MGQEKELSKAQIGKIRANIGRKASQLANRMAAFALEETINDKEVTMNQTQVTAAKSLLSHVLPAMQSTELLELTGEGLTKEQHEANYKAAMAALKAQLKPEDITPILKSMDKDTRQALVDSLESTSQ